MHVSHIIGMKFDKPKIEQQSLEDRYTKYMRMFHWDKETMLAIRDGVNKECRQALRHHKNPTREEPASMPFLDTCVSVSPTGKERGIYYAVDFGGTNLRVVRVEMSGTGVKACGHASMNFEEYGREFAPGLPRGLLDSHATATMLFDSIALFAKKFMTENGDLAKAADGPFACGFTFSFPMEQHGIDSGVLTHWNKNFETGRDTDDKVEGEADVCQLLDTAFSRNEVPLRVSAALNDTTGTLLSAAYSLRSVRGAPPCCIGLIVGTGMNACYIEKTAPRFDYQGIIINTECGGYRYKLPRNIIDRQVDCATANLGQQLTEKICSGLYLAELCRRAILRVFRWEAPPLAWVHDSLSTAACCAAAYDADLSATRVMLDRQLEWPEPSERTLEIVRDVCRAVLRRSANMVAVIIAALAKQSGRLQYAAGGISVGIDGSVFVRNPQYREDIAVALRFILGDGVGKLIHLHQAQDGSGLGAAILAALEDSRTMSRTQSLLDF